MCRWPRGKPSTDTYDHVGTMSICRVPGAVERAGGAVTVTTAGSLCTPSARAMTLAVPGPTATTTPDGETVMTVGSLPDHCTARRTTPPRASRATARSVNLPGTLRLARRGFSSTDATDESGNPCPFASATVAARLTCSPTWIEAKAGFTVTDATDPGGDGANVRHTNNAPAPTATIAAPHKSRRAQGGPPGACEDGICMGLARSGARDAGGLLGIGVVEVLGAPASSAS